jgi:putative ABC transport system permease protein
MLKSYFRLAWRNLAKQKGLSFISLFGLSVGIACFLLFLLYAVNEFNFDGFHKNADDIYLVLDGRTQTKEDIGGSIFTEMPLGPAMKKELADVKEEVRYVQPFETFININKEGRRENLGYTDPAFFSVFSFKLKYGNPTTALADIHNVVLTEQTAKRLFGRSNAIGETFQVKIENVFQPVIVTGIAEDPPSNSSFQFTMLASFARWALTEEGKNSNTWGWDSYLTFVQLTPGSSLARDGQVLADFKSRHPSGNDRRNIGPKTGLTLAPIKAIHTNPRLIGIKVSPVDPKMISILLIIAAGVLLIACINFTTLAIGRSARRSKEVGVRKVIGGTKRALIFQFFTESILLTVVSAVAGLLLAKSLLPYFNRIAGRELVFSITQFPQLIGLIIATILVAGLLAGFYPALLLSAFKAVDVLKTKVKLGGSNLFTKSLVTIQFFLSATMIISAIIILQQLHYMRSKNPGFDKENVVELETYRIPDSINVYAVFKQGLATHPEITGCASAQNGLGDREGMSSTGYVYDGRSIDITEYNVDADYIPTLGMQVLAGRNFNPDIASDTVDNVIINEALMHEYGWTPEKSIGKRLKGYDNHGLREAPTVIGVVKDFNYLGLQHKIGPQIFLRFPKEHVNHFFVRLNPGNPSKALTAINTEWKKILPDYPIRYNFLDEDLGRFYQSEERLSNIIGSAGGLSIFLSCIGLLGLSVLAVSNRTKEIGIRKVLGASVTTIIQLISKGFLQLVGIAIVVASPIVWWVMNKWLEDYAYRVRIEWWVFVLTGVTMIGLALLTVGFQAIKAAIANPVKSLRTE